MRHPLLPTLLIPAILLVSGCATHSANMRVGNEATVASLRDQREAQMAVREYDKAPAGSRVLTKVDAARCHRSAAQTPPTRETVLMDLKVAAYAAGATGITDVSIEKKSGLSDNCWYVLNGTATAITGEPEGA